MDPKPPNSPIQKMKAPSNVQDYPHPIQLDSVRDTGSQKSGRSKAPKRAKRKARKEKSTGGNGGGFKGSRLWRAFKWLFGIGLSLGVVGLIAVSILVFVWTRDLPTVTELAQYKPAQMTRMHAGDGKIIAEYATEHRVFVQIEAIPKALQHAFVAAEDQRFYEHGGIDWRGLIRSQISNVKNVLTGKRLEGGSTITQQVAKNFLVGNDRKVRRKVREMFIARKIEKALDKDHILELYVNEIFFARRSYGVAAASLNYFGKSMDDLTLEEMAYLAILPKGPNNYKPEVHYDRAINRRNYAIRRMVEDGYATQEQGNMAMEKPLIVTRRLSGEKYLAAEYFVEEARRKLFKMYGEEELYSGGLSVRTTLDTNMQLAARRSLRKGLEEFDKRHGYRGGFATLEAELLKDAADWSTALQAVKTPRDIGDWRKAVVLEAKGKFAKIGLVYVDAEDDALKSETGSLALKDMAWAREDLKDGPGVGPALKSVAGALNTGDVIFVSGLKKEKTYALQQVPNVNGGLMAIDPHTGRVLALVGGYSFAQSQFNRATQAYRQPGSAFKPFVYSAALDNGFTPVSKVLDVPFVIRHNDQTACDGPEVEDEAQEAAIEQEALDALEAGEELKPATPCFYKPENYSEKFYGLSTLRLGIEKSRNAMTVRLANDMGMANIIDYGKRFGIYDEVKPELAWALGAGETTVMRLTAAYGALVNNGVYIEPKLIDRVQDRSGKTIFRTDIRECADCLADSWDGASPPSLPELGEPAVDPVTAYQMTSMLEGTVLRGTGRGLLRLGRPLAGKTGTTNDEVDAWFMGFSPDLAVGVYVGYDTPAPMKETGAKAALPIFRGFMREALKGQPKVPFRIPEGVLLAPVEATTGEASFIGAPNTILEAFRPGTEPRLGQISDTIRVGGGVDSFIGGYDGYGGDEAETDTEEGGGEDTDGEDKKPTSSDDDDDFEDFLSGDMAGDDEGGDTDAETDPETVADTDADSDAKEDVKPADDESETEEITTDEGDDKIEAKTPIIAKKPAPKKPAPKKPEEKKPAEDELDDGLY